MGNGWTDTDGVTGRALMPRIGRQVCYNHDMTLDTDPRTARAAQLLEERLRPATIVLFGSRAVGRERQDSDVDLGVLCDGSLPDAFTVAGLKTELEDILGRSVDLVVLNSASPILAMEVLRSHRVLSQRDPEAFEAFTVRTLLAYFDLKQVRAPIEQAILARGAP
jgi:hypothetical protein